MIAEYVKLAAEGVAGLIGVGLAWLVARLLWEAARRTKLVTAQELIKAAVWAAEQCWGPREGGQKREVALRWARERLPWLPADAVAWLIEAAVRELKASGAEAKPKRRPRTQTRTEGGERPANR